MAGPSILEQAAPSWRLTRPFMLPRAAALVTVEFSQDSLSFMGTKPTPRLLSFPMERFIFPKMLYPDEDIFTRLALLHTHHTLHPSHCTIQ